LTIISSLVDRTHRILAREPVDVQPPPQPTQQQAAPSNVTPRENMEELGRIMLSMAEVHRELANEIERISQTYHQEPTLSEAQERERAQQAVNVVSQAFFQLGQAQGAVIPLLRATNFQVFAFSLVSLVSFELKIIIILNFIFIFLLFFFFFLG
jgi:hypothetical protein